MTNQEAVNMLKAKIECMKREISGIDSNCNDRYCDNCDLCYAQGTMGEQKEALRMAIDALQTVQPERLTDDDFETIRIHLSAHKERLCNQHRWEEAEEYQRIIDRFMRFASAQPETAKRIVGKSRDGMTMWYQCDMCNEPVDEKDTFCSGCGRRFVNG